MSIASSTKYAVSEIVENNFNISVEDLNSEGKAWNTRKFVVKSNDYHEALDKRTLINNRIDAYIRRTTDMLRLSDIAGLEIVYL